jgi:hypothetical protein
VTAPARFAEHQLVALLNGAVLDDGTSLPAGVQGYIVHPHSVPPGQEPAYIVEVIILNETGQSQIDWWLIDIAASELVAANEAARVRISRVSERVSCKHCGHSITIQYERAEPPLRVQVAQNPACPGCGAQLEGASGAITPLRVSP